MSVAPCSHCKRLLDPVADFTQRTHASCTKTLRSGERKTYRTRHPKGRSYVCRDCEAQRMRDARAKQVEGPA